MAGLLTFDRDDLFEFFGRIALPGPGRQGFLRKPMDQVNDGEVDCAMLAEQIIEWVDAHAVSEVEAS